MVKTFSYQTAKTFHFFKYIFITISTFAIIGELTSVRTVRGVTPVGRGREVFDKTQTINICPVL